jgi:flagellar basal-body rod protein FlgF
MDNLMLVSMQTQRILQRRMEIAANNLANAATTGFKADSVLTRLEVPDRARAESAPHDIRFARDVGLARDMSQGILRRTDNPFDLAIQGEGFFTVEGGDGPLFTRDGQFALGADGRLLTRDGRAVLNAGGQPIVINAAEGGQVSIAADGTVRQGEQAIGQIGLAGFASPGALEKIGDGLYRATGEAPGAFTGELVQGSLEGSNVNPVLQLTSVMEIARAYEGAARIINQSDDLRARAIERLARA